MEFEKDGEQPRIHGNAISIILERAYHKGGEREVFKVAKDCISGLEAEQLVAIAKGKARLDGNNIDGLEFKEN